MATLEIHDGRNQVRRVRISRENPVMFGSDPMCDIVLDGSGVQPFHGRIRWKGERYKADASPEVPYLEVNGVQVKSKSIRQGDEIRIGKCRIFLLSLEEGPDQGEKTVVRDAPMVADVAGAGRTNPRGAPDFHRMEMAPPSVEASEPRTTNRANPEVSPTRSRSRSNEPDDSPETSRSNRKGRVTGLIKKSKGKASQDDPAAQLVAVKRARLGGFGLFKAFERAPGDDRVAASPLVIGLAVAFALLVAFSFGLWGMIARSNAFRQYNVAMEDMEAANYLNAIKSFDAFLTSNPTDKRSGKAKVLRALAKVRQHTGATGASWGNAVLEARAMVEEVGQVDEYRDSSLELAEDIRKAAEGLADRAAELADANGLGEAEAAVQLHARVAGQAAAALVEKSKIPAKLDKARAAIRKARDRTEALASIDAALKTNRPGEVYSTRDRLILRYPEMAGDKEVSTRLLQANDLVQKAVTYDPSGRPGETLVSPEPLGPPTSLVLRLEPGRGPTAANGAVVYALADGALYGLDAASGSPRWQFPVGLAYPFPPLTIAGDPPSVIAVDSRSNELIRVNGRTGVLIWRQTLGGSVVDPPLVLGNQVFQPTLDGLLLQIDLASGALRGTLQLGRRLARTPVADDSVQHLYLLADEDCLFVLALDPLSCVGVEYLGHEAGSVACPPARVGRFYILPENDRIDQGRWRVFVIDEAGTKLKFAQEVPIGGWTLSTPASSGPVIWSCSDRGELSAYAVGLYDAKIPLTSIARVAPNTESEGPAFPRAKSEREFWIASSRSSRIELDLERGRLNQAWTLGEAGPAIAPLQAVDKLLILTQQHNEGAGTSLWGVDAVSGQVRWRTVLGSAWPLKLVGSSSGDAVATLANDGQNLAIGLGSLRVGGFVEQPLPKAGLFRLPPSTSQRLEIDGATVIVPEPGASRVLVRSGSGEFRPVELPAPLATTVLALGKNLLIAGADGRVYLIDPKTGTSAADPYIPPFDRSKPIRWRSPVALEGEAVALADGDSTIRRISVDSTARPRLAVTAELKLDKPMASDPASTGPSVLIATIDGKIRSIASRDLGPQGTWTLEAPLLLGPLMVADHAFVADSAGNVLAFAPDGRRLWSAKLRDTIAAGPPALLDQSAWFLGRDGSVQRFALLDGSPQSSLKMDVLPAGGALAAGPELVVPTGLGTVRVLDRSRAESSKVQAP